MGVLHAQEVALRTAFRLADARNAIPIPEARRHSHFAFDTFERNDGTKLPLLDGYRDSIKRGWRVFFPETRALYDLAAHQALDPDASALHHAIEQSRTLPMPLDEVGRAVDRIARERPELFAGTLDVVPPPGRTEAVTNAYRLTARSVERRLRAHGGTLAEKAVLDLGTASGYLPFALSEAGAGRAVGVDLDLRSATTASERTAVRDAFGRATASAELLEANAEALPFDDRAFDVVLSFSFIEHVHEPALTFAESARVLRPGGLCLHVVDPWHSPQGGHALCTLDSPWGHLRLSDDEFERYLSAHRRFELPAALAFYRDGFQRPRRTPTELRAAVEDAGLTVIAWRERRRSHGGHVRLLTRTVLDEARARYPRMRRRDLLTDSILLVARRH